MLPPDGPRKPGPLVILMIVAGGVIALCAPLGAMFLLRNDAASRRQDAAELEALKAESHALREDALKQIENEGFLRSDTVGLDRILAAMRRSAERMGSEEARATLNAVAMALNSLRPSLEAYSAALSQLEEAGGLAVESLPSLRRIEERLDLVDHLDRANTSLADAYAAMPDRFEQLMIEAGVDSRQAAEAATGFRESSQMPITLAIRRTDTDLCEAMRGLLRLLRDRWGRWEYNDASDMVMFHDDADAAIFNQWMARLQAVSDEQSRLQRQALGGS